MTSPSDARRAAVLGHPISHSLSPVLHTAAYRALGLHHWTYSAVDVDEEDLAAFVSSLDESWAGLSLTMPLKRAVLPLLDHVEPQAAVLRSVNTVIISGSGPARMLTGANTDVHGIVGAIREAVPGHDPFPDAVVLGAGATSVSAMAALAQLGVTQPTVLARSMARTVEARSAAHRMGIDPTFGLMATATDLITRASVVISTLPPGAADGWAGAIAVGSRPAGLLLDVAYGSEPTPLVTAWRAAGAVAIGGERMLLHQAGEQVRLMTGQPAPLAEMDLALTSAIRAH